MFCVRFIIYALLFFSILSRSPALCDDHAEGIGLYIMTGSLREGLWSTTKTAENSHWQLTRMVLCGLYAEVSSYASNQGVSVCHLCCWCI